MSSDENDFEEERRKQIQRNQELLARVGLQKAVDDLAEKHRARKQADAERRKAKKRKAVVPAFPTRRSTRSTAEATRTKLKGLASGVGGSSDEGGGAGSEGTAESGSDGGASSDEGSTGEDSDAADVDSRDYSQEEKEAEVQGEEGGSHDEASRGRVISNPRKVHVCGARDEGPSVSSRRKSKDVGRGRKSSGKSTSHALTVKEWPALGAPEIKEGFRKFDEQGIGLTTLPRIVEVAESLNVHFEEGQLEAMMDFAEKVAGCDGQVLTLQEFEGLISNLV
ncbi:hypothetical protein BSKO_06843 [Bryopsis sp. KO-2023]|nr:hypothetical protein BSKO_06843 [Bryopsis sp. KO-2023]